MAHPLTFLADPSPFPDESQPWDDDPWEVFIPDEDQLDPLPDDGDFWAANDGEADRSFYQGEC